ncbi:SagB family peptide dehydrogenase [Bacillus sp. AFS041924]|uniref:SagB family peptide dehydrogenase n=1 Tax=Bacillus sp. AFS041924 TaxID=2033503 RepID=UPI000BFE6DE0|nr:SagB family peptide dehydrogenase [Bacillus sp. AFS041924]PGS51760.1 NADH oxidase [Bacillus sp. AFS041924]
MSLQTFLHNLHFDIEKANQSDWEVDWEDAPLTYKLYKDLPTIPLSLNVPLSLKENRAKMKPNLNEIGYLLWYVYGLTQVAQTAISSGSNGTVSIMSSNRRFVPSGGGLYPNELYVYLKCENVSSGIYHYDVARHCLVLLREGNFDSYVSRALGNRCEIPKCFCTVFISTMFWKNFFKYNNFSYRLQGLDCGVLMGQILEMAKRFGFKAGVYYQFLDQAINHLIGLHEREESVYSTILLTIEKNALFSNENVKSKNYNSTDLSKELPTVSHQYLVKSKRIKDFPMLIKMNKVAMMETTQTFRKVDKNVNVINNRQRIMLPKVERISYDLATVCKERFSPEMDFILHPISQLKLATLLQEATASFSYLNDLDESFKKNKNRPQIYLCLYKIEGINNGAYYYDDQTHSLEQIKLGDHRVQLQNGMNAANVNLFQVPICLHVVGNKEHIKSSHSYRGYRIQQMEAGMMVQRLLIAASALGLGGHPLLGYNVKLCDELYQLDEIGKTSLIQIPIGYYRNRPWIQGSLHS